MSKYTKDYGDGALLYYNAEFFSKEVSDNYFADLRDNCVWSQKAVKIAGREVMQPRLTSSYGNEGITYYYSGSTNQAIPWTKTLLEIKHKIEDITGNFNFYNYCLLNQYRSEKDSVGWHTDSEKNMNAAMIGSLSLGETRRFRIKNLATKEVETFEVKNGTLILMAGTFQDKFVHEVPKETSPRNMRINLTFRKIKS